MGARPLNLDEQQRMYREPLTPKNARLLGVEPAPVWKGPIFQVSDDPFDAVYRRTADVPAKPAVAKPAAKATKRTRPAADK